MAITIDNRTRISTDNRFSRYVQGGLTDKFTNRIGVWERYRIPRRDDDIPHTIEPYQEKRPDLIANAVYGKASLMWLVLQYNHIVDPETELFVGRELLLPTQRRVMTEIINKQTGGNPVT